MWVTNSPKEMPAKESQSWKGTGPQYEPQTAPKLMLAKEVQPSKALGSPMWVTNSPKEMPAKEVALLQRHSPPYEPQTAPKLMLAKEVQACKVTNVIQRNAHHRIAVKVHLLAHIGERDFQVKSTLPLKRHYSPIWATECTQTNARQRGAVFKGTRVPNVSHKLTQRNARQRIAVLKRHWSPIWAADCTQINARQRGAAMKRQLSPMWVTNSPKEMHAKEVAVLQRHSGPPYEPQTAPKLNARQRGARWVTNSSKEIAHQSESQSGASVAHIGERDFQVKSRSPLAKALVPQYEPQTAPKLMLVKRGAVFERHSPQCESQTHPKKCPPKRSQSWKALVPNMSRRLHPN